MPFFMIRSERSSLPKLTTLAISASLAFCLSAPAHAQGNSGEPNPAAADLVALAQFIKDVGGAERINMAGRLRMLSQRMSAATCYTRANLDTDIQAKIATDASAEYDKIISALESGDDSMGIFGPEGNRKVLAALQALKDEWATFGPAVNAIKENGGSDADVTLVSTRNLELLAKAQALTTEVSTLYSNPAEMLQSDALRIEISGRERMLTQKMAKEACAIVTGNADLGTPEMLEKSIKTFDASLLALRDGNESAGIEAPPTVEIKAAVDAIWASWEKTKVDLEAISRGEVSEPEKLLPIAESLQQILAGMNEVTGMYAAAAKQNL